MTHREISQLIERFLNTQTTEAEEQALADYFQNAESVPEEWQPVKELFLSFQTDAYELTDSELATLTAEPTPTKRKVRLLYWLGAAAACAAILFIIGSAVLWNDAKEEKIAKTETNIKDSASYAPGPKGHPLYLRGGAHKRKENLAKANTQIEQSPSNTEEKKSPPKLEGVPRRGEGVCPEVTYEENHEAAPDLLADNSSYAPALKGTPSILEGESNLLPQRGLHLEGESNLLSQRDPRLEGEANAEPKAEMVVYSETDLPINNPQNLIYTEEDIQKLQKIYRQRLIAEIQNDVEVSRHNLSQLKQFLANN